MSTPAESKPAVAPVLKGIVNVRESQLRLVTSVRLRWMAVLGQLAAVALIKLYYGFPFNIGNCLILIAMSAWLNVFLSIRYPARYRLSTSLAFGLLVYDVLQLAGLLYFTGGIQNPFSVLLVAPVTVAAATQPMRYTFILGAIVIAVGGVLISFHDPLPWYEGLRFELPRDYKVGSLTALVASMIFMAFYTWRLNKEARQMSAAHRASGKRIIISAHPLPGLEEAAREEPIGYRRPGVIYGLGNLIENAVSFAASEVHLSARWNATQVVVTIIDDGQGFKPEMMDTIGEPYVTSRRYEDKGDKGHSGLGLGLFIAKTLLERSGATVTFSNQPPPRTGAIIQIAWPRSAFELPQGTFDWPGARARKANTV